MPWLNIWIMKLYIKENFCLPSWFFFFEEFFFKVNKYFFSYKHKNKLTYLFYSFKDTKINEKFNVEAKFHHSNN